MPRFVLSVLLAAAMVLPAAANSVAPRDGWRVIDVEMSYADLLETLRAAVKAEKMGLVTEAGPTEVAAKRGETIPGNRVVGVFRNDFAVRAVRLFPAAMIEAPIRFYVTEDADGTATLSWKTPSFVFAPYMEEAGPELSELAGELDAIFEAIGARATEG
ncbi:MAG: DUF302 domain-containing protein [Pseudomonadota bacterium]